MLLSTNILSKKSPGQSSGFTLVEMLTTLAIIATLATLLLAAVSGAKRKSRQAVCLSNLRQYSVALNMYLDDERRRPGEIGRLIESRYLQNPDVLICPEDRWGGWGNRVNNTFGAGFTQGMQEEDRLFSFLHPLGWQDWAWNALARQHSNGGIGICQLHGIGRPDPVTPGIYDFQGLTLRAHLDGSVTRGMVFWDGAMSSIEGRWGDSGAIPAEPGAPATPGADDLSMSDPGNGFYPWPLFLDRVDSIPLPANN